MKIRRRSLIAGAAALSMPAIHTASAADNIIRIGMLDDMSGQYSQASGPGDALGGSMAAEDFMATHPDNKVEVTKRDILMKPDVGANLARQWFDLQNVDAIFGIPHSAVALAVSSIATEKDKVLVLTAAGIPDLTGKYCSKNHVQWTYDLWSNSSAIARGLVAESGDSWFFLNPD